MASVFTLTGTLLYHDNVTPLPDSAILVESGTAADITAHVVFVLGSRGITDADGTFSIDLVAGTDIVYRVSSADRPPLFQPIVFSGDRTAGEVVHLDSLVVTDPAGIIPSVYTQVIAARDAAQGYAAAAAGSVSLVSWQPSTAYVAGNVRQAPDGSAISRIANGTSRSSFDATEALAWTAVVDKAGTVAQTALSKRYLQISEAPLSPFSPTYGADPTGTTDITTIVQQVLDDAWTTSGSKPVSLKPGRTGGGAVASHKIKQLKLGQGQILDGGPGGMFTTRLIRVAGAAGAFIREKTAGEGNADGAQGVTLRNLYIDCASIAGNGIDLGNQGGSDLGFNAVLQDVHVRNAGGDGFALNADAIVGRNLSAYFNGGAGFKVTGHGQNNWFQVSTSRNLTSELDLSGQGDTFHGLHVEPGALTTAIFVRAAGVKLLGLTGFPYGSVTNLIELVGSTSEFSVQDLLYALNGGFTLAKWVKCDVTPALDATTVGTGNIYLREWSDNKLGQRFIVNIDRGTQVVIDDYGRVQAHGFWLRTIQTKNTNTTSYAVGDNDSMVNITGSTAGFTLTLPSAANYKGRTIWVKNSSTQSVTVNASAGTVDTTTLTAGLKGQYVSDGSTWIFV